mgnify:CR=1 FL=1
MFDASKIEDADPDETREWLESIDSVLRMHGPERAHYLLEALFDKARADLPNDIEEPVIARL